MQCIVRNLQKVILFNNKHFRTAAALRAIVIAFLWSLLQCRVIQDDDLKECFNDLHTHVSSQFFHFFCNRVTSLRKAYSLVEVSKIAEVKKLDAVRDSPGSKS